MKPMVSLLWKELHELRWFWYAGMALMVLLPLTAELYEVFGFPGTAQLLVTITLGLGAALAVLVAVATVCRDLDPRLEAFWRSRPISTGAYVGVKLVAGLAVVLSVAVAAILLQHLLALLLTFGPARGSLTTPVNALLVQAAVMTAVYALAFAIAAATAQAVPATFLALLAVLLVYFVPVLVPPLAFMNVLDALREPGPVLPLLTAMLVLAGLAAAAAWQAIDRQMRVAINVKSLGWTLAVILLLMVSVATMQVGSNLTPERIVGLTPTGEHAATSLVTDGRHGAATMVDAPGLAEAFEAGWRYRGGSAVAWIDLEGDPAARPWGIMHHAADPVWLAQHPTLVSYIHAFHSLRFTTVDLEAKNDTWVVRQREPVDLLGVDPPRISRITQHDDTLLIFSQGSTREEQPAQLWQFQIEPDHSLELIEHWQWAAAPSRLLYGPRTPQAGRTADMLPILGLSGRDVHERLAITFALARERWLWRLDEHHLVRYADDHGVEILRIDASRATGTSVPYQRVGQRRPTPLERMAMGPAVHAQLHGDLLVVLAYEPRPGAVVFDLADPARPRKLGHYGVPGQAEVLATSAATADGRIILAGRRLHIFNTLQWR